MTVGPGPIPDGLDATLVLLRHAESEWIVEGRFQGRSETPLSPMGRRQAELAARRLGTPHASPALPVPIGPPSAVVHSPLRRAAATAEAVGDALAAGGLWAGAHDGLRADAAFAEIGQGEWEGRHHTEIAERWGDVLAGWRRTPTDVWAPGGEPLTEVQARVRRGLASVLRELADLSGSGGRDGGRPGSLEMPQVAGYGSASPSTHPWSIVVGHDGVFKVALLTLFELPLERFWMFTMALCGITVVELRGGRAVLRAHNLTEHLAPLLDERAQEEADRRQASGAL
ncbi:MAG TPA: histidine phosphatase family protein [Candidatus Limnocylindrales bacterium]|nr:histidine phosphatase family protein [Candidatus Limnocylindrales bacterium]